MLETQTDFIRRASTSYLQFTASKRGIVLVGAFYGRRFLKLNLEFGTIAI